MKTIGVHTPNPKDATSFYRAFGPFSELTKDFNVIIMDQKPLTWVDVAPIDILFLHRPFSETHAQMADMAKTAGKKLWLDFDDDLFNVHHSNKNFHRYDNPQVANLIKSIIRKADIVTSSTSPLCEMYRETSKNPHDMVIENAIPDHITAGLHVKSAKRLPRKMVLWRGTEHHEMNLLYFKDQIIKAIKEFPDWVFCFMGYRPWYIMEHGNPGQSWFTLEPEILNYLGRLTEINAAIQIVPLADTVFNRAKSSIAYMEGAAFGGSMCIAPDWPEWSRHKGIALYDPKDRQSFFAALKQSMELSNKERALFQNQAHEYVLNECLVSKTNKARRQVIEYLSRSA